MRGTSACRKTCEYSGQLSEIPPLGTFLIPLGVFHPPNSLLMSDRRFCEQAKIKPANTNLLTDEQQQFSTNRLKPHKTKQRKKEQIV
jgi:hypothetical protein